MEESREDFLKVAETSFLFVTNPFHILPATSDHSKIQRENRAFGEEKSFRLESDVHTGNTIKSSDLLLNTCSVNYLKS